MHNIPAPAYHSRNKNLAAVLGEFGGLGLGIDGHIRAQKHWGYQGMDNRQTLIERRVELLTRRWR